MQPCIILKIYFQCVLCHTQRPKVETSSQTAAENDDCRSRLRVNRDIQTPLYSPINCPTIRRNDHLPSETTEIQVWDSRNIIV